MSGMLLFTPFLLLKISDVADYCSLKNLAILFIYMKVLSMLPISSKLEKEKNRMSEYKQLPS